jgi:hypothetical protein
MVRLRRRYLRRDPLIRAVSQLGGSLTRMRSAMPT